MFVILCRCAVGVARSAAPRRGDWRWDRPERRSTPERGLDEALGLAVGLGRVGLGANVLEAAFATGVPEVE